MKRLVSWTVIATLGLGASAYASAPAEQAGAAQPSAAQQPYPGSEPQNSTTRPPTEDPGRTSQSDPSSPQAEPGASAAQSGASSAAQSTRLSAIVPAGMSAQEACGGFKGTEACAAALHASQNLGISFAELKSKVTGGGQKLDTAIRELKPDVNVKAEVRKAEEQARTDVASAPQG